MQLPDISEEVINKYIHEIELVEKAYEELVNNMQINTLGITDKDILNLKPYIIRLMEYQRMHIQFLERQEIYVKLENLKELLLSWTKQ